MRALPVFLVVLTLAGAPVKALDLQLPGPATLSGEVLRNPDSYPLPVGAYAAGALPTRDVEGRVLQQAWKIDQPAMTTLQIMRPIAAQLADAGYGTLFECDAAQCGGFDFRFNTRVMSAPDMYVDLFDYRYLAAQKGDEYLSILVSRSAGTGYVQVIQVATDGGGTIRIEQEQPETVETPTTDTPIAQKLKDEGHVILRDLDFETGSAALVEGPHASLSALAMFLKSDTRHRIVLVGHTDAVGMLENNIALSQRRAASVLERLVSDHGVPRSQLDADGIGFLSPIAPNLSPEGREANRRVEAVLLDTE